MRWLWSVVHNCFVHPLFPFTFKAAWVLRLHDYSAKKAGY